MLRRPPISSRPDTLFPYTTRSRYPNRSFVFANGMDPEDTAIGRVARRIWARAIRERYGANERSQMMKYHIQTSGRALHAQEIQFNDIRTTLQALYALLDRKSIRLNYSHSCAYRMPSSA